MFQISSRLLVVDVVVDDDDDNDDGDDAILRCLFKGRFGWLLELLAQIKTSGVGVRPTDGFGAGGS